MAKCSQILVHIKNYSNSTFIVLTLCPRADSKALDTLFKQGQIALQTGAKYSEDKKYVPVV